MEVKSSLWDEFSFLSDIQTDYDSNSLYDWCMRNGDRGSLLLSEWSSEKNRTCQDMEISPREVTRGSRKEVWWKCTQCGNEFQMAPAHRTGKGQDCPVCSHKRGGMKNHLNALEAGNDLYSWCLKNGEYGKILMEEWDEEKNRDLLGVGMADVTYGSGQKVYWKCLHCKESFECTISHRVICGTGCGHCNPKGTSFPEQFLYMALKQIYPDCTNREKLFGGTEFDICMKAERTCIEYNGSYWHKHREDRDREKRELCRRNQFRLIQIVAGNDGEEWKIEGDMIQYHISNTSHLEQLHRLVECLTGMLGCGMTGIDLELAEQQAYRVMYREVENNITITHPQLVGEWDEERNQNISPKMCTAGSKRVIKWKCSKCNNIWENTINSRITFQSGCPACGYNVFDDQIHKNAVRYQYKADVTHPELLAEWDKEENGEKELKELTAGSGYKAAWRCTRCHGKWRVTIRSRTYNKSGCPHCGFNIFAGKQGRTKQSCGIPGAYAL